MEDKDALRQNLMDAGCDPLSAQRFMSLLEQGQEGEALALLTEHRKNLLERCHAAERKIDCLDYLVYQMKRNATEP